MRILVTGGAGFIGSHLSERLVEQGHEVVVYDDLSSGSLENLSAIRDRIELIEADLLDIRAHAPALEGVQRIYHLAALISGHDSLYEPEAYERVNVVGLLRLIEVVRALGGVRIVFASSSTVYGNAGDPVKRETQPAAPLSIYALTKYTGEHALALYRELYGFDFVALRLFNVYGPRQSPEHPYANVTCKFAHAAATGGGIELYGDGEQTRDFVYVEDVVAALLAVGEGSQRRVYNVGTGEDTSIRRLLEAVKELAAHELPVKQCDPWPNDIRRIRADVSRLEEEFGFRARVGVEEGLRRTVDWFRSRGG
jgi:UDP-glucose 4-epimerase